LPIDTLIPYSRNPRTHSEEQVAQIAASIREFGFTNPILIDGKNGIIAGHGRFAAAKELGLDQVPCIDLSHLTDDQRRALVIADNKIALNGGWNDELLRLELTELRELGADLKLTGFDATELACIMLGKDVEFKEYDESAADDVQLLTCPKCGHTFPR
jgi:ParB-like chromosome segregation protein Spo0J